MAEVDLPAWAEPLLQTERRYKVMHGGRGGGKSWAVAISILLRCAQRPTRVLCAREIQKSMRDSVHRLLKDQIVALGLAGFFEVLDSEIRGRNGSLILFSGLQAHTVDSIKSFEGVDLVWIEEAHCVSQKSLEVLIPTIRAPDSEIWMTLNPDLETDPVYTRFVAFPDLDMWVKQVNWRDNPWFPPVLEAERLRAKRAMSDADYLNVWEGKPRSAAEGAIYKHEITEAYAGGRVCRVPYDPALPVHTVWDLGWNDAMSILFVQCGSHDIRIIDYVEDSHRTLDWYVAQLETRRYRFGVDYLPHDARHGNFHTGKTTAMLLHELTGRQNVTLRQAGVEEGIRKSRLLFPRCYFDAEKTNRLLECLKRYRRMLHTRTSTPMAPEHDEYSHGADAFRYLATAVELMMASCASSEYHEAPLTAYI